MSRDADLKTFPDIGSLIDYMDRARANGDEELRAQYEKMYERSQSHSYGWGTHIPLLAAVVATARPGPVLEIGVGRSSSPLLVEMCRAMGRRLVGVDNDPKWCAEIAEIGYPVLGQIGDWAKIGDVLQLAKPSPAMAGLRVGPDLEPGGYVYGAEPATLLDDQWSVIFIDHGPAEARLPVLKACRGHAEFIVCHDAHNPGYLIGFDDYLDTFKYRSDYTLMAAQTSVVSDLRAYPGAR